MRVVVFVVLLLALLGVTPAQAAPSITVEWRDAATIRADWSTPGQVACVYVEVRPTGLCGEFGGALVPFQVYPGQLVTMRAGDTVLASAAIPASPYPAPMAIAWVDATLSITIADPAPARCLWLVGGYRLDTPLPDSCGKTTYTLGPAYQSDDYRPIGRTLRLVDTGQLIYDLPIRAAIALPFVARP